MKIFYNISTTNFQPISFGNVYLYSEYNRIKNFLASNNQIKLLKILAIPSFKKNNITWTANTNKDINKLDYYSESQQHKILSQYYDFQNEYKSFINEIKLSKNQDNKKWSELLLTLIDGSANELFFDGESIFITWGWKLLNENSKKLIPSYISNEIIKDNSLDNNIIDRNENSISKIDSTLNFHKEIKREKSIIDKLHLFLSNHWWIVPFLSLIILILILLGW